MYWSVHATAIYTETKMSSFWRNFNHWLHWKLSFWQLPVQPVMKISSKWRHFRFSVTDMTSKDRNTHRNVDDFLLKLLVPQVTKMSSKWWHFGSSVLAYYHTFLSHQKNILKTHLPLVPHMRQWIGWALVQIMACRLFGVNPLSKPMLGIVSWAHIHWNLIRNSKYFIGGNAFENVVCENGGHFV